MARRIRLLLVDDDAQVRRGLRMHLAGEPEIEIAGEAADARTAVQLAQELQPEIVLMDLLLPLRDGIQATRELRSAVPACAVIAISVRDDAVTRRAALAAGATAFVGKQEGPGPLLAAIRAAAGRHWDSEGNVPPPP